MGDRYYITVICPNCGNKDEDVYYAPTCGFVEHTCSKCNKVIDLEEYTGIDYDSASNRQAVENMCQFIMATVKSETKKRIEKVKRMKLSEPSEETIAYYDELIQEEREEAKQISGWRRDSKRLEKLADILSSEKYKLDYNNGAYRIYEQIICWPQGEYKHCNVIACGETLSEAIDDF